MNRSNGVEALFVGRSDALQALEAAFDSAAGGQGSLVALSGEPGIGKTTCAEAFARHIEGRGALVLWGRCLEQPGAPPFWPWIQILRDYVDASSADELRMRLGSTGPALATLLPEIAERLDIASAPAGSADPPEQRVRLFDAVSRALGQAAVDAPVTLIIDDLHWADASSLSLLEYLCDELRRQRLLVVCAYRDVEVAPRSRLQATLGTLTRVRHFGRLRLGGLDLAETARLAAAVAGEPIPARVVEAIFHQTDGNPLFVHEVARVVAEQRRHGRGDVIAVDVPDGVREAIGQRVGRLPDACSTLLGVAAVIGREFDLHLVARVLQRSLETTLAVAQQATAAGILEALTDVRATQHRFTHALIRETLYDQLPALERMRLHRRIATALQSLHAGDEALLSELVHHACESAALGDVEAAVSLALRAARRDERVLALEEAAHHYDLALRTLRDNGRGDDERIPGAWFRKAHMHLAAGQVGAALESALQGAEAARGRDPIIFAHIVQLLARINSNASQEHAATLLAEALAALPDTATERRSAMLAHLAMARRGQATEEIDRAGTEAVALARQLGSPDTLMMALRLWAQGLRGNPHTLGRRLELGRESVTLLPACRDAEECTEAMYWHMLNLMEAGATAELAPLHARYAEQAETLHLGRHQYQARLMAITLRLLRGEWAGLEAQLEASLEMGRRLDRHDPEGVYGVQMFQLNRERERLPGLAPLIRRLAADAGQKHWQPGLLAMCIAAELEEYARPAFEALAADDFGSIPRDDMWVTSLIFCADACIALGDAARARVLYDLLAPFAGQAAVHPTVSYGAIDRPLGLLAETAGDLPHAIDHMRAAVNLDRDMQAWPALARSKAELGRLLQEAQPEAGRALLTEAEQLAARLDMPRLAERIAGLMNGSTGALPDGLTAREADVLKLLAIGRSNKDVSRVLGISLSTVATHVRSILDKTGCANRTEAAAYAIRQQLN